MATPAAFWRLAVDSRDHAAVRELLQRLLAAPPPVCFQGAVQAILLLAEGIVQGGVGRRPKSHGDERRRFRDGNPFGRCRERVHVCACGGLNRSGMNGRRPAEGACVNPCRIVAGTKSGSTVGMKILRLLYLEGTCAISRLHQRDRVVASGLEPSPPSLQLASLQRRFVYTRIS
eukprot:evm.model.scf_5057.1 EVM.evm.TU.scf_5057.1   scf_5057:1029-1550(+)